MFGLSPLGLFILIVLAMVMIGPRMLPASVESIWLAVTNLQRQNRNEELLTLEEARVMWRASGSVLYQLVQTLNAVVEHLEEMRSRILYIVVALVLGTAICLVFYNQIYGFLLKPISGLTVPAAADDPKSNPTVLVLNKDQVVTATLSLPATATGAPTPTITQLTLPKGTALSVDLPTQPQRIRPVFLRPTEMFVTTFKVCLLGGFALALPMIIFQIVAFIWPALIYEHEKRWVYVIVPFASVFFVAGVLFSYFFLIPFALKYLLTFAGGIAVAMPSIGEIVSFETNLMFWIGMVFQTPLVVFFLAKAKIVAYPRLKAMWKIALLIAFVVGALITPTPDPINQLIVATPIFLLYLLGLVLARFA
jgi:sec-independent protein translocase protein TatC